MSELYELFSQHPRISTDTRRIEPDSIFFALRGDTFDGNRFVAEALEKGAAYAVSDDPQVAASDGDLPPQLRVLLEFPGGFSAGVAKAYELGAAWFWVMDDDVAVLPDAIAKLSKWTDKHEVIQGSRFDYDGGPFYWQYDFIVPLGIPNPIAPAAFGPAGYRVMDTLCFEGGLFNRRVVTEIGLPDPRFFIYWDDTMYGYRASKVTNPIVVPDVILRRTREIGNWDIAGVRQLNSTSDMNRYHIMRNRGYMARYFMTYGDFRPLVFGLGTVLTAAKEVIRLVMVDREHLKTGLVQIAKGWWDSRKLMHDPTWKPMPSLK